MALTITYSKQSLGVGETCIITITSDARNRYVYIDRVFLDFSDKWDWVGVPDTYVSLNTPYLIEITNNSATGNVPVSLRAREYTRSGRNYNIVGTAYEAVVYLRATKKLVLTAERTAYFEQVPDEIYKGGTKVSCIFKGNKQCWPPIQTFELNNLRSVTSSYDKFYLNGYSSNNGNISRVGWSRVSGNRINITGADLNLYFYVRKGYNGSSTSNSVTINGLHIRVSVSSSLYGGRNNTNNYIQQITMTYDGYISGTFNVGTQYNVELHLYNAVTTTNSVNTSYNQFEFKYGWWLNGSVNDTWMTVGTSRIYTNESNSAIWSNESMGDPYWTADITQLNGAPIIELSSWAKMTLGTTFKIYAQQNAFRAYITYSTYDAKSTDYITFPTVTPENQDNSNYCYIQNMKFYAKGCSRWSATNSLPQLPSSNTITVDYNASARVNSNNIYTSNSIANPNLGIWDLTFNERPKNDNLSVTTNIFDKHTTKLGSRNRYNIMGGMQFRSSKTPYKFKWEFDSVTKIWPYVSSLTTNGGSSITVAFKMTRGSQILFGTSYSSSYASNFPKVFFSTEKYDHMYYTKTGYGNWHAVRNDRLTNGWYSFSSNSNNNSQPQGVYSFNANDLLSGSLYYHTSISPAYGAKDVWMNTDQNRYLWVNYSGQSTGSQTTITTGLNNANPPSALNQSKSIYIYAVLPLVNGSQAVWIQTPMAEIKFKSVVDIYRYSINRY